jgi:hypothetical protein
MLGLGPIAGPSGVSIPSKIEGAGPSSTTAIVTPKTAPKSKSINMDIAIFMRDILPSNFSNSSIDYFETQAGFEA